MVDILKPILLKLSKEKLASLVVLMAGLIFSYYVKEHNQKEDETMCAIKEVATGVKTLQQYTVLGFDSVYKEMSNIKIENNKLNDKFTIYNKESKQEIQDKINAIDELYKKAIEISQIRNTSFEYLEPIKPIDAVVTLKEKDLVQNIDKLNIITNILKNKEHASTR